MSVEVYAFGNVYTFDEDIAFNIGLGSHKNRVVELKLHPGFKSAFEYIYYTLHGNSTILDPDQIHNIIIICGDFNIDAVLHEIKDLINDSAIDIRFFGDVDEYKHIPIIYNALCLLFIRENFYYDDLPEEVQDYFDVHDLKSLDILDSSTEDTIFFRVFEIDIYPNFNFPANILNIIATHTLYISPSGFYVYAPSGPRDYIVTNNYIFDDDNNVLIVVE